MLETWWTLPTSSVGAGRMLCTHSEFVCLSSVQGGSPVTNLCKGAKACETFSPEPWSRSRPQRKARAAGNTCAEAHTGCTDEVELSPRHVVMFARPACCCVCLGARLPQDVQHNALSIEEVVIAEVAVKLLTPFQTPTTLMCSGTQPTASLILPITNTLLTANLMPNPNDIRAVTKMKCEIHEDLGSRYPLDSPTYTTLMMASALDPQFKAMTFVSEVECKEVHIEIVREALRSGHAAMP